MKKIFTSLRRFKLASTLNILGLAIAFTVFIVIMMQVNFDLNFDKHFSKGERTFRLEYSNAGSEYIGFTNRQNGEAIGELSPLIDLYSIYYTGNIGFYLPGGNPEKKIYENIQFVKPDFFKMFDIEFLFGGLSGFDDQSNVVVSRSFALKHFGTEAAVGSELMRTQNGKPHSIKVIGVYADMPQNSLFNQNGIFVNVSNNWLDLTSEWGFTYFYTLKNASDKAAVETLIAKYIQKAGSENTTMKTRLSNFEDLHFLSDVTYDIVPKADRMTVAVLFSVAILILIIASINFLNFAMALTPMRIKGINIQKILGGSVASLRAIQIAEAVFLAIAGYAVALLAVMALGGSSFAGYISSDMSLAANVPLLAIALLVAVVVGVGAGITPAIYSTSFPPSIVLQGAFGGSPRGRWFRMILIGFQYLASIGMLIFAMFMVIQNEFMRSHDVGFDRDNILSVNISSTLSRSCDALSGKLLENGAIRDVTYTRAELISDSKMGWGRLYKEENVEFDCLPVSPNFIRFMGMKIVEGRDFVESDNLKANGAIIFNQNAKRKYGFEIGEKIEGHTDTLADIVGVVRDFNFQPMQYGIRPIALYVFGSDPWWPLQLMYVKVDGSRTKEAIGYIDRTMRAMDPKITETDIRFMDQTIGALYEKEQKMALLVSMFSLLAITISLIGVFGLVIFETQYRRREIALRKVYGSTVGQVLIMLNRRFAWIVAACFVIATPVAYHVVSTWLEGFAYRTPMHWWVALIAFVVVMLVTVITVTIQSYKSATENPISSIHK